MGDIFTKKLTLVLAPASLHLKALTNPKHELAEYDSEVRIVNHFWQFRVQFIQSYLESIGQKFAPMLAVLWHHRPGLLGVFWTHQAGEPAHVRRYYRIIAAVAVLLVITMGVAFLARPYL